MSSAIIKAINRWILIAHSSFILHEIRRFKNVPSVAWLKLLAKSAEEDELADAELDAALLVNALDDDADAVAEDAEDAGEAEEAEEANDEIELSVEELFVDSFFIQNSLNSVEWIAFKCLINGDVEKEFGFEASPRIKTEKQCLHFALCASSSKISKYSQIALDLLAINCCFK